MNKDTQHPSRSDFLQANRTALDNGKILLDWWLKNCQNLERFELLPGNGSLVEMSGFFADYSLFDGQKSIMGCIQKAQFRTDGTIAKNRSRSLAKYIEGSFIHDCHWEHQNGSPAGFTYSSILTKESGNNHMPEFSTTPDFGVGEIGKKYEWVLARVDIHDFVRSFQPVRFAADFLSNYIKEKAYIVFHEEFGETNDSISSGGMESYSFGYSFLPVEVEPNLFGFGPGKFGTAVKQFHFRKKAPDLLEIQILFIVAPRSQKVLDFWGFDPVYTMVHVVDLFTLSQLEIRERFHKSADSVMLRLHGQVHHNLLLGMQPIWGTRI